MHQVALICTKLHQSAPNYTNLHQTVPSCHKLNQVEPSCSNLHQICERLEPRSHFKSSLSLITRNPGVISKVG